MLEEFSELDEVISAVTPEMLLSARSSIGAATLAAIVVGSAPGRLTDTRIVGNSRCSACSTREAAG